MWTPLLRFRRRPQLQRRRLKEILQFTYDAKVTKNLNVTGIDGQDVNLVVGDTGKEAAVTTE